MPKGIKLVRWSPPDMGALFVVTGPSGTGKTTLVKAALENIPSLSFSVSATTRRIREGENDGVDYHFLSGEKFSEAIEQREFLEWAEVYGNRYGTLRRPVESAINAGQSIILDIDPQGAEQIRKEMPTAISVFILPPSRKALENRLVRRQTDSVEIIRNRMEEASKQLSQCRHFDYLLINDDLESAIQQFQGIIISELAKRIRRKSLVRQFTYE